MSDPKHPGYLSNSVLNRELDKLDRESSALTDELIAAGRGHEKILDTLKMTDPLAERMRTHFARRHVLRTEVEARYGPDAPHRLGKGGPRKKTDEGLQSFAQWNRK